MNFVTAELNDSQIRKLEDSGIVTLEQLVAAGVERLSEILGEEVAESIFSKAQQYLGESKENLKDR